MRRGLGLCATASLAALAGCRIESATPGAQVCASNTPSGDVWVYTSIYRNVLEALDPLLKQELPTVTVHWFQAGSEKVSSRLEAEFAAGGTQCDILATSDPFAYRRYKREGRWLPYVPPGALRTERVLPELVDEDGDYVLARLGTMVLIRSAHVGEGPTSFGELRDPKYKGQIVIGDALASGTSYTWALFASERYGPRYFDDLRANQVRIGGGNAAVVEKVAGTVAGSEAKYGVALLENAVPAVKAGSLAWAWPTDGAVMVPGFFGIFKSTRNPVAAKAVEDFLMSPKGEAVMINPGLLFSPDPRQPGPDVGGPPVGGIESILPHTARWAEKYWQRGDEQAAELKAAFSRAFSK